MTKVFIDDVYACFTENADGRREVESDFFDGKCKELIECFKFVPLGESYTDEYGLTHADGVAWNVKDVDGLVGSAQRTYELHLIAEYEQALSEIEAALGVAT